MRISDRMRKGVVDIDRRILHNAQITLRANAKINLTLDILGRRDDGYHELETVMQSIGLYDRVTVRLTGDGLLDAVCDNPQLPQGRENLAGKAAERFFDKMGLTNPGIRISVEKHIPLSAGLGGGSADAAAVIEGLDRLLRAGLTAAEKNTVGLAVGADVPFCLVGGTAVCRGVGERIEKLPPMPDCCILLSKPPVGVSTAEAYAKYDRFDGGIYPATHFMTFALASGSLEGVAGALGNMLEAAVDLPAVEEIRGIMRRFGVSGACMTGSGSAVFGLFHDQTAAEACARQLKELAYETTCCRPAIRGIDAESR